MPGITVEPEVDLLRRLVVRDDVSEPPGRSVHIGTAPAWPAWMIKPSESESARWAELWTYPQAAGWMRREMQTAVVSLVRLEQRCSRRRSSPQAHRALADLRRQLGLDEE